VGRESFVYRWVEKRVLAREVFPVALGPVIMSAGGNGVDVLEIIATLRAIESIIIAD
jgi:aminoglycoside phosphotransferase (APT) family kinase protein